MNLVKKGLRSLSLLSPVNDTLDRTCQSKFLFGPSFNKLPDLSNNSTVNALLQKRETSHKSIKS